MAEPKPKYSEKVETHLCRNFEDEYVQSKSNRQNDFDDFETFVDLFEQKRSEKDYDWMSDVKYPEYISAELTQQASDAGLNFKTRDFAEIYLEEATDEAKKAADAAKACINKTLNRRDLYYYQKRIRAGIMSRLSGQVHAEARWSKQTHDVVVGIELVEADEDINGEKITNRDRQIPRLKPQKITHRAVDVDQFELDILDNRNVLYDSSYTYSLQEKPYVIIRSDRTLDWMKQNADLEGFFNLDYLTEDKTTEEGKLAAPEESETSRETYNKYRNYMPTSNNPAKSFDVLKRLGKAWCIVEERDQETGLPIKVKPGVDDDGYIKDEAELHELVQAYAYSEGKAKLIAFHPTPYVDCYNRPYRNILRGLCYFHPTEDGGFGDAKHAHDLQVGLDDTLNMSNDRSKLATIPVFGVNPYGAWEEHRDEYYFEPGHFIPRREEKDLTEFKIQDNIQGAMQQASFYQQGIKRLMATDDTVQGRNPAASTTATAIMATETRSNDRFHYKALNWTNTWDADLYWMILQMTYKFAEPDTGYQLMGKKIADFHPELDYFFKPVTAAIESEQSKAVKLRNIQGIMQVTMPLMQLFANQPGFLLYIEDLLYDAAECMNKEVERAVGKLFNPQIPPMPQGGQQAGQDAGGPGAQNDKMRLSNMLASASNQTGVPMGGMQAETRMAAGGGAY